MDTEPLEGPRMIVMAVTWAAAITMVCTLVGQGAVQFASMAASPNGGPLASTRPDFRAIDFGATGSIKGQAIVINPCTGKQLAP